MELELRKSLPPIWSEVRQIRDDVSDLLRDCSKELRQATAMTASELVENAIKYGLSVPAAPLIEFTLRVRPDCLRVEVTSGAKDGPELGTLERMIGELEQADDQSALAATRLEESVMPTIRPGNRGLYRIGGEGRFDLSCKRVQDVVTVVATRRIQ